MSCITRPWHYLDFLFFNLFWMVCKYILMIFTYLLMIWFLFQCTGYWRFWLWLESPTLWSQSFFQILQSLIVFQYFCFLIIYLYISDCGAQHSPGGSIHGRKPTPDFLQCCPSRPELLWGDKSWPHIHY